MLEKEFEHLKSCDVAVKSHFILEQSFGGVTTKHCCAQLSATPLIYGNCANQSCMALTLVCCNIKDDQGGRDTVCWGRVSLVSWEEEVLQCCL